LENRATHLRITADILLVEDDETVREVTAALLQEIGYRIHVAATSRQALELCADSQTPIDLLLTDIIMPGMNGKELSELIVKIRPATRVLFMSGYAADVLDLKMVRTDGLDFIEKPFDLHSLHQKIQSILLQNDLPETIPAACGTHTALYS